MSATTIPLPTHAARVEQTELATHAAVRRRPIARAATAAHGGAIYTIRIPCRGDMMESAGVNSVEVSAC